MRSFWRCGMCGYRAYSDPWEENEVGTYDHVCPTCGDQDWLSEETWLRSQAHTRFGAHYTRDQLRDVAEEFGGIAP